MSDLDELADQIRRAYLDDTEPVSWESIPEGFKDRWRRVATRVVEIRP